MANTYGRQVVVPLTNKSGGGVIAGDVVIVGTANNDAFTTTTSAAFTGTVGIAQETIADNATGRVLLSGYAALINTTASVTRQNYGTTSTTVKKAVDAGASRGAGTFVQFLTGGTTPDGIVFPSDLGSGSGTGTVTTIKDEGSNLSTAVVSLDFVGTGVTATGTTAVTVTVPGKVPNAFIMRTAGDLTITNDTSWHDVPTIGDLTIAAVAGDVLEITMGAVVGPCRFEVQLPTSGNYVGPGVGSTQGIASWANRTAVAGQCGGVAFYTVVSGDISGGNVLVRLRYTTNASGSTTLFASTAVGPLIFGVKNLRQ